MLKQTSHNDSASWTCVDCGRWAYAGEAIVHSKRCDSPTQPAIDPKALDTKGKRRAAGMAQASLGVVQRLGMAEVRRRAREGYGLTADELFELQQAGVITVSEAMNRDD